MRKRYNRYALLGPAVYFFMLKMGIAKVTASRTVVTTPVITWISANKSALVTKVSPPPFVLAWGATFCHNEFLALRLRLRISMRGGGKGV